MEKRCLSAVLLLAFLFIIIGVNIAVAQWSPIKTSGYAVTTNWHGTDVPLGEIIIATAGTTDPDVTHVEFIWRNSSGIVWDENVTVSGPLTTPDVPSDVPPEVIDWATNNQGIKYWYAQNKHIPNALGEWGVQAMFHNATKPKGKSEVNFVIRSASFNVVPDAPIVGTAGMIVAMLIGLGLFKYKSKRNAFTTN
jgi:hypothetical protein